MSVTSFANDVFCEYGVELPIVHETLDAARREAQRRGLYLLVYVHSPTHEDTAEFLTQVMSSPQLRELVGTRLVLFGASVLELEGRRLEAELQVTTFPFLALLLKRTAVLKLKGLLSAEAVVKNLQMAFDHWDGRLAEEVHLRLEREEKERARREEELRAHAMQELDRERIRLYEEQLRERREREERQRREVEAAEEAQQQRRQEEAQRRSRAEALQAAAAARLPQEPPADADPSTVAFISLKSLRGTQHHRRFYRSDKLRHLRDYAMSLADYTGGGFRLVAGYPPRPLELDGDKTFGDVPSLLPRAVVLMRGE
ncbi:UBX domain containing protein [Trypanosoma conorhini]|uniref:UBX domain containing protein n=1 Tax=Trypanosoma conorhini TaxID=83891 RepID=A0A422PR16_9TRYP|nr:UBX domain containing protein [Trypanosoma conorhini]RNF20190.1 UBX domain containing protein [Trypanosoma conorhini]